MHSREVRRSFLAFFERHGHRIVPSSSLVPVDDPTLLFTNAGMNQFKDVFLGRARRDYRRAASVQKCMRVSGKHNDLDSVGPSVRHHTFFEMLGNFSFGDYFKAEAIAYAWTLLTEEWKLPPERLVATIFRGEAGIARDEEAYTHWRRYLPPERIAELGLADNFWAMGDTGPCGRCSEIHYYRDGDLPCPVEARGGRCAGVSCQCDRFVEIWNNVFMEFDRQPDGALVPLPAPSIDTGMGLERITAVLQGKRSNYDTDLFAPIIDAISGLTGVRYGARPDWDASIRVVADHLRATSFLIADGVVPSNEWRGYVLRKILRRAMRHGKRLGMREPFLYRLVEVVVEQMGEPYPELRTNQATIVQVVRAEEERFDSVLATGLPQLEAVLDRAAAGSGVVPGDEVFRLYDTLGVPVDFIEELAGERRLTIDADGFERAMAAQRQRARAGSAFESQQDRAFVFASEEKRLQLAGVADQFEGYTTTRTAGARTVALFDEARRQVPVLPSGARGYVLLDRTPFYVEAGGQVSDTGRLVSELGTGEALVETMTRLGPGGPRLHVVRVIAGRLAEGDLLTAEVDAARRDAIRRNHTATHLLHAALRTVLGPHVKQAGSLVAPDRLRFDFLHYAPLTRDELDRVEDLVNRHILRNAPVVTEIRATEEAIAAGAMALFGEKYGERVRVVSIPDFSMELCGGTHCRATGEIGLFLIVSETGVAAGVRRIEALTGEGALEAIRRERRAVEQVRAALNVPAEQVPDAVERLQQELRRLARELRSLQLKAALGGEAVADDVLEVAGIKMVARRVSGMDREALRGLADSLRDRLKSGIVVLASATDGKVAVVVSITPDLKGRLHAGEIVRQIAPIVGGGGGGRPEFAEAGGRLPEKIDELLLRSRDVVQTMLEARRE
jgi:alanyl-tRNA synthetase